MRALNSVSTNAKTKISVKAESNAQMNTEWGGLCQCSASVLHITALNHSPAIMNSPNYLVWMGLQRSMSSMNQVYCPSFHLSLHSSLYLTSFDFKVSLLKYLPWIYNRNVKCDGKGCIVTHSHFAAIKYPAIDKGGRLYEPINLHYKPNEHQTKIFFQCVNLHAINP